MLKAVEKGIYVIRGGDDMKRLSKGLVLILFLVSGVVSFSSTEGYGAEDSTLDLGKRLFESYCVICHGDKGDGKGVGGALRWREKSGQVLNVQARDFTIGVFKFRSTPTGCLPLNDDILHIVTDGIPKSFMPSHKMLTRKEREALVAYIKTFSTRWGEEEPCQAMAVKKPQWVGSLASVEKGRNVYKEMKCWECHGERGEGDGPKAEKLQDDWGVRIFPFDFTTADLKRGTTAENIYITFTTGLDGTGMPSYEDSLNEEDRWHLVSYTLKLMGLVDFKASVSGK